MGSTDLGKEDRDPVFALGASEGWELRRWLGGELRSRVPGSPHQQLAETFLQALDSAQARHSPRVHRAILRQEVWRLLVTLRRSREDDSEAIADFEAVVSGLTQHMEKIGVGGEAVQEVEKRLWEALAELREWPLV